MLLCDIPPLEKGVKNLGCVHTSIYRMAQAGIIHQPFDINWEGATMLRWAKTSRAWLGIENQSPASARPRIGPGISSLPIEVDARSSGSRRGAESHRIQNLMVPLDTVHMMIPQERRPIFSPKRLWPSKSRSKLPKASGLWVGVVVLACHFKGGRKNEHLKDGKNGFYQRTKVERHY